MIDVSLLPDVIGKWKRKSEFTYIHTLRNGLLASIGNDGYVHFGTYIPCGANLKKVPFSSVEDVIKALEDFTYGVKK